MPFKFKKASCVAVGTFNIYVVQPRLLVGIGMLKKGIEVKFEQILTQPGFRFSADGLKGKWTVRPDRLIVETDSPDEDCGQQLSTVLKALRWTPVVAIGVNVEFESATDSIESLFPKAAHGPKNLTIRQRTTHVAVSEDGNVFNLQAAMPASGPNFLSGNVHTELKTESQKKDVEKAIGALRQFNIVRERATELLKTVFKVRITNV